MNRPDPRDLAAIREQLVEAAGLIYEAEQRLDAALGSIGSFMPGFRSDTLPVGHSSGDTSQPENYKTISADHAVVANAELRTHARLALASSRSVYNIVRAWATPPPMPKAPNVLDPGDWCASCLRIAKCSPRHRGDLCRWCYDFNRAEHQRPPVKIVRYHHEGRRITQQMVDDAIGRKPKRKAS